MSGTSKILASVIAITRSSGTADTNSEFIVRYHCTGPVTFGDGETVLEVDVTQSEAQITGDLSSALAAHLNPIVQPPQSYVSSDVRGLNI